MNARWSISRAAALITALTAVSTLLGFVRDVVIGAVFGAGSELDAYLVAQGLMNILLGLVASAVARSVTPVTAREAAEERGRCPGHPGFDVALTLTMVTLGLGGVVMGVFAGPVTAVMAPGFSGEQAAATEGFTRIVLVATVLIAGTDLLAAVVQAHGRFAWSALEGVPFNVVMITAAAVFGPRYGVTALAVGFVVGSGARLLMQVPPVRSLGIRLRPRWDVREPGFREIARMIPPMIVGSAVVNVNTLVDRAVGSTLEDGTITALSYGWRLIHLPETLIVTSLLVPLYPALSAAASERVEVRRLVGRGLAVVVTVLAPLCIILAAAAEPLVDLAFGYGAFDTQDVTATATAVAWYAPALLALAFRQVVVRASYAVGDSRGPVVVAVVAMVINVVGDILLAQVMGLAGIAAATTASLGMAAVANTWLLHRRHQGVDMPAVRALLLRATVVAVAATSAGYAVFTVSATQPSLVTAVVVALAVIVVYLGGLTLLRAPERHVVTEMVHTVRGGRGSAGTGHLGG